MAIHTLNADNPGAFSVNVGGNSTDDIVVVNIGEGFSGTIAIQSSFGDGELETVDINLPSGWEIVQTTSTPLAGETPQAYYNGFVVVDDTGIQRGTITVLANQFELPCFAEDTTIRMSDGTEMLVQTIQPGDSVQTLGGAAQNVLWVGKRKLSKFELDTKPELLPIKVSRGSLGPSMPNEDLFVSPQHRLLVRSSVVYRMFEEAEVLVPAKLLLEAKGIEAFTPTNGITYYHILLESHAVIWANGAEAESLLLGPEARSIFTAQQAAEIEAKDLGDNSALARLVPPNKRMKKLIERHIKNGVPFQAAREYA